MTRYTPHHTTLCTLPRTPRPRAPLPADPVRRCAFPQPVPPQTPQPPLSACPFPPSAPPVGGFPACGVPFPGQSLPPGPSALPFARPAPRPCARSPLRWSSCCDAADPPPVHTAVPVFPGTGRIRALHPLRCVPSSAPHTPYWILLQGVRRFLRTILQSC